MLDGVQTYQCTGCAKRFRNKRKEHTKEEGSVWHDYVFRKQVLRELIEEYHRDIRTLHQYLIQHIVPAKEHVPRSCFVVVDALYFRKKKHVTPWCAVVFRDPLRKENLWWGFGPVESTHLYLQGKLELEALGYTLLGVTGDGIAMLRKVFTRIPFQMCLVHMERIIIRKITRNPQTEAGKVLLALTRTLRDTPSEIFRERFTQYIERYRDFLNERTAHPESGSSSWTHQELRSAVLSLKQFEPYLFTHEIVKQLPQTSNSLEGHFGHVRDIVRVHRGISDMLLRKMLCAIFLASTIAPRKKKVC